MTAPRRKRQPKPGPDGRPTYEAGYRRADGVWVCPPTAYLPPETPHKDPFFAMVGDGSTKRKRAAGND